MCKPLQFPGFYGVLVGVGLFCVVWIIALCRTREETYEMDPLGERAAFEPLLTIYMDIAKFVLGLASASIAAFVGATVVGATKAPSVQPLISSLYSPLCLLGLSILYGAFFMMFMMRDYETYRHNSKSYTRCKYSKNQALGFSCLVCFGVGYAWLIVTVTGQS